ncbi:DUF6516 family protein [Terasakiella sp. SH-1]|uniref:toxin-antitoxin system TumE family protein n=1 Tax=Terasakiella sp. SH-1 TaxID=2560057 RepID=UPI0010734B0A|nr:DUF6516 family protein [Terasakiella sp. SH-1]
MAKAKEIYRNRYDFQDGAFMQAVIWEVPTPVPPSEHSFKYSLFYGRKGQRIVCYDNERGKGDHKHINEVEYPYQFESVEKLVQDFLADVEEQRND